MVKQTIGFLRDLAFLGISLGWVYWVYWQNDVTSNGV